MKEQQESTDKRGGAGGSKKASSTSSSSSKSKRKTTEKKSAEEKPFIILALEGGPMALLIVSFLQELEGEAPGFLDSVDLFAGTSSGAMTSMILASSEKPSERLKTAEAFWRNSSKMSRNSMLGYLRALYGFGAVLDSRHQLEALQAPDILGDSTLGDLPNGVAAVSFEVNPTLGGEWAPRIFTNIHGGQEEDRELLAADVALRSGSSPLVLPIHQGSIDGGVAANNPSLAALVTAIKARRQVGKELKLEDVRLMSVGLSGSSLDVVNGDWGYMQWLFNMHHPLALLNLLIHSGGSNAEEEVATLLPDGNFHAVHLHTGHGKTRPLTLQHHPAVNDLAHRSHHNRDHAGWAADWLSGGSS